MPIQVSTDTERAQVLSQLNPARSSVISTLAATRARLQASQSAFGMSSASQSIGKTDSVSISAQARQSADAMNSLGSMTDADLLAESPRLNPLQIRQQLGIQSLSMANQQPGALMALFR